VDETTLNFDRQSVIVTGGATGIGESCSHLFAQRGASVTVMDFDEKGAERVAGDVRGEGGDATISIVDLTDFEATRKAVEAVHDRFGRLDVLVHSAGGFPRYISLIDMPVGDWEGVMDANLKSMFYLLKAAAPLMIKAGYGRFVTLSSAAARSSNHSPHYTSAKTGVLGLTRQAARELGPNGITVNAVAPASVNTPRTMAMRTEAQTENIKRTTPLRRLCEPEEIAWPILFLCSREGGYITGVTLDVNGGSSMV
jgi:NAD(P)-dependent dehydrogenase (short-subunit alcohol dehydrogenase family)